MKYLNLTKQIAGSMVIAAVMFSSCKKTEATQPVGDKGTTIVRLLGGEDPAVKLWSIDFVPVPATILAVDIRRDVPNEAMLNTQMTVVVKDDQAAVTALDPSLLQMPAAFYTYSATDGVTKVGGAGGTFTFTFKPGEFAKTIYVTIPDATVLSTSDTYGLGFTITSVSGGDAKISASKSIIYKIGAKNKYDGVYRMVGKHNRSPYNFPYDQEMDLITSGAAEVRFYWPAWPAFGHPIGTGPDIVNDVSMYGGMEPAFTFNPATNEVASVRNTASSTATLWVAFPPASPGVGRFEPASKTMYVYWYYTTGAGQDFSNRGWSDTLTYLGSR
jgi:hypothetical protein